MKINLKLLRELMLCGFISASIYPLLNLPTKYRNILKAFDIKVKSFSQSYFRLYRPASNAYMHVHGNCSCKKNQTNPALLHLYIWS